MAEFQRLAGEGRALLATAEPAGAIATLTAALEQWRGASGDGLPRGTALDNRWASLDEQRLQVFEELAEARLAAGQHGDLLPELRGHLAAHPLRERAWGQLMLALYRCGDVPAALTVYRDARAVLDEQLGIEPGEDLATLHRAMLDRAPELSYVPVVVAPTPPPTAEVRPAVGWTVPRELPADLVTFVGRTRETADVVDTVGGAKAAAVVVTGAAGSGKTALAVRAAHAVAGGFPDGQVFVDLGYRNSVTPGEVLARVLRALGVAPADVPGNTDERAGWFRSLAAGRRFLLVVDGVTRAAQVRPLLPAGPGPALIVVGQRRSAASTASAGWRCARWAPRRGATCWPLSPGRSGWPRIRRPPRSWSGSAPVRRWRCGSPAPAWPGAPPCRWPPWSPRSVTVRTGWICSPTRTCRCGRAWRPGSPPSAPTTRWPAGSWSCSARPQTPRPGWTGPPHSSASPPTGYGGRWRSWRTRT
ncbi:AfsR/SARP family transcriptional regulator [Micromonospora sp. ATA51]|uniref:AfsR/SARP family transcriptional regulator n=1 Tax=Micromonospora sp. ATA51 TaxID=2806098 RepID=UPI001EE3A3CC|nr:AfsR/SARP family transcriptional regulator [Micromonospora sp. ATA51]